MYYEEFGVWLCSVCEEASVIGGRICMWLCICVCRDFYGHGRSRCVCVARGVGVRMYGVFWGCMWLCVCTSVWLDECIWICVCVAVIVHMGVCVAR